LVFKVEQGRLESTGTLLERILDWDFDRIVLSHGENIESDAKAVLRKAWARPLSFAG